VLVAALNIAEQSGDAERKLDLLRRQAALDADDAALQSLLQKVEAQTAPAAPKS
jgi:Cdc6-like AAA superfamily ATPase